MKIAIVTGTWGRPTIFELFAQGIKNLPEIKGVELEVIVAGSEGKWSRERVKKHGFHYIEIENHPLAAKMNKTLHKAKKLKSDYVICLGSDDIMSPNIYKYYISLFRDGFDFIGVTDCYFYNIMNRKAIYWGGYREDYRRGHTCGAFRALSKNLLDQMDWECWLNEWSHGLDTGMQLKLQKCDYTSKVFSMQQLGLYGLDIKSPDNMTKFELWDNSRLINNIEIFKRFPYLSCAEYL